MLLLGVGVTVTVVIVIVDDWDDVVIIVVECDISKDGISEVDCVTRSNVLFSDITVESNRTVVKLALFIIKVDFTALDATMTFEVDGLMIALVVLDILKTLLGLSTDGVYWDSNVVIVMVFVLWTDISTTFESWELVIDSFTAKVWWYDLVVTNVFRVVAFRDVDLINFSLGLNISTVDVNVLVGDSMFVGNVLVDVVLPVDIASLLKLTVRTVDSL